MSFRVVLARPRGADPTRFEGVYLHNGARPGELGPVLWTLLRDRYRFDAARFGHEMIDGNLAGWSSIDCLGGPLARTWDGTTKLTVEQHQANFDADRDDPAPTSYAGDPGRQVPGITAPPIDDESDNWGAELVYVIGADGLHVVVPEGPSGPYVRVASLPWGDDPDWDAVDADVDAAFADLDGSASEDEDDDDDDRAGDGGDDTPYQEPHETAASLAAVAASFELVRSGRVADAQAHLLAYLDTGGPRSPQVLTNLIYTLTQRPLPSDRLGPLLDEVLAELRTRRELLTPGLIDNLCIVLNNVGRGAESVALFEYALAHGASLDAACYVGMTFGAYTTQDPVLMQRAVAHVERVMADQPALLVANPAAFDNTAALYLALGDRAKTLAYVRLCKQHGYVNFADMPSMPDYAAIRTDPEFRKLFRR